MLIPETAKAKVSDTRLCPKCGQYSIHSRTYLPPHMIHDISRSDKVITGECIVRTCGSCDYEYSEPTEDSK